MQSAMPENAVPAVVKTSPEKENKITNARFYQGDAGEFMENMAENGEHADVVFMDPPRTGSDKKFMSSVIKLNPSRIVYISCGPETLARDLEYLTKHGYDERHRADERGIRSTKNPAGRYVQFYRPL